MLGLTVLCILLLFIIGAGLFIKALPVIREKNLWVLLSTSSWKPFKGEFGFLVFILSTLHVTYIAILIALPLSILIFFTFSTSPVISLFPENSL